MYIAIRTYEETVSNPYSTYSNRGIEPEFIKQTSTNVEYYRDKQNLIDLIKQLTPSSLKQYKFYAVTEVSPKIEVSIDI